MLTLLPFSFPRTSGALLLAAAAALAPLHVAAQSTEYPTAPEENLAILPVRHRPAAEVLDLCQQMLAASIPEDQRAQATFLIDGARNTIIIRGAGPGATWPSSVRRLVSAVDTPAKISRVAITLRRVSAPTGEAGGGERPVRPAASVVDRFESPGEPGSYAAAWLQAPDGAYVRVLHLSGPAAADGESIRLVPVRVEVVPRGSPAEAPGAAVESAPGAAAAASASKGEAEPGTSTASSPGARQATPRVGSEAGEPIPPASGDVQVVEPSTEPDPGMHDAPAPLPPPVGEVIYSGSLTLTNDPAQVVGPFRIPGVAGSFEVQIQVRPVEKSSGGTGAEKPTK